MTRAPSASWTTWAAPSPWALLVRLLLFILCFCDLRSYYDNVSLSHCHCGILPPRYFLSLFDWRGGRGGGGGGRWLTFVCVRVLSDYCAGGAVWHSVKGFRNSPKNERLAGALTAVKGRAPILGGNFAVWCVIIARSSITSLFTYISLRKNVNQRVFICLFVILKGWNILSL